MQSQVQGAYSQVGAEEKAIAPVSISVRHVTRLYTGGGPGRTVVRANDDLSFEVRRGEIFGLLGPNGAGKTTLVMQLLGLVVPTSGSIRIEGVDVVANPDEAKKIIGFLPQSGMAMRFLEVERALRYTGCLRGQTPKEARLQSEELMQSLGLEGYAQQYVDSLSGGQIRLVNFAMSLMGRPRVLILDEPTNELDPEKRRLVWDTLARLNVEQGLTCVLVTHNVLEAERVIQRVAVMREGRIMALGTPGELKARAGGRVRLELNMKEGQALSSAQLARLETLGELERGRNGEHRLYLAPEQSAAAVKLVTNELTLEPFSDLRLSPPALEDLYLELIRDPKLEPVQSVTAEEVPPAAPRSRPLGERWRTFWSGLLYLWLEQVLEFRTWWPYHLAFAVCMPLAMVFGLSRFGTGLTDEASLLYIISGGAVSALVAEGLSTLAFRVSELRRQGLMVYYASLPVSQGMFVTALIGARSLVIFPGLVTPLVAGHLMYGVNLHMGLWFVPVMPLSILSLAAVGMVLGSTLPSTDLVNVVTNLILFLVILAAPVFMPMEALPMVLRGLAWVMPSTYAAEALRHGLSGQLDGVFYRDLLVLAGITVAGLTLVSRGVRWRVR